MTPSAASSSRYHTIAHLISPGFELSVYPRIPPPLSCRGPHPRELRLGRVSPALGRRLPLIPRLKDPPVGALGGDGDDDGDGDAAASLSELCVSRKRQSASHGYCWPLSDPCLVSVLSRARGTCYRPYQLARCSKKRGTTRDSGLEWADEALKSFVSSAGPIIPTTVSDGNLEMFTRPWRPMISFTLPEPWLLQRAPPVPRY
ncbi:hypothetical protein GGS23DRAFT_221980 [Durotheca rogersii]|uniref:uncharacterized protein n=1 Tax=Durotheca rogersii TaxID=419775 RepID=UPI00221F9B8A|nr:uncharacterized protein GGS23DRAFT_221980 [Durotheca rogersii]KAI5860703.1 hypothetical protein GGS23DRAFT_221980 [Durotheca rogersii]